MLVAHRASLEEAYMELTAAETEYAASGVNVAGGGE